MRQRLGTIALVMALAGTARCPVGCRRREPLRSTYADAVQIPLERIGPCKFRILGELPRQDGFFAVHLEGESADTEHWNIDAGILTTFGGHDYCSPDAGNPHEVELVFYEVVPVGGRE